MHDRALADESELTRRQTTEPKTQEKPDMTEDSQNAAAQIATLCAADFATAIDGNLSVRIVPDAGPAEGGGEALAAAILIAAVEKPGATMPGSPRTAFVLRLKVSDPGAFECGYGLIDVPGKGPIGPVYLQRTMAPPGDPTGVYFGIQFN